MLEEEPFNLTAQVDLEEGYSDKVCLVCSNNLTSAVLDLFTVT